jgi:hypothetical protein
MVAAGAGYIYERIVKEMIYELRTYWAEEGMHDAIIERFRSLTMGIFKRLGMQVVGFWTPDPITTESGDLVYLMAFQDEATKDQAWATFRYDPEWVEGRAASEVNGHLVTRVVSILLKPTDFSPMK